MKSLAFFVFLLFAVPGSGQMIWDGLPFSTRTEFASLVILFLAVFNNELRSPLTRRLQRLRWRGAVKPALAMAIVLKLLTFAWYPFSDGFDACYRSIYIPLPNTDECEKSYEGPFLRRSDMGLRNTSRIERTVDFGTHAHDWSLPFMNEYPRLGNLWLFRFPFTAQFGARIDNRSSELQLLPIYGNGEMSGSLGESSFTNADVAFVDRYQFPRMIFAELNPGTSEFILKYRYSDDDSEQPPDKMPPMRGPYALLKIGEPQNRSQLLEYVRLRIRGHALDTARMATPDFIAATTASGVELARTELEPREDVAAFYGTPTLVNNAFNFTIPSQALLDGVVIVKAGYGPNEVTLGSITKNGDLFTNLPKVSNASIAGNRSGIEVWYDADRNSFFPFAPSGRVDMGFTFKSLVALLDLLSGLIVIGALFGLLVRLRESLVAATALGLFGFMVVRIGGEVFPSLFGSQLTVPLLFVVTAIAVVSRKWKQLSLVTYLPLAVVLAAHMSFDQLQRFHGSKGERWWGRLLYYWRDSDWYATQGYARTVFLEGSLHGGESVFWFQAGPRYLALVTRVLLGENDVLVGVITTTLGFLAVIMLYLAFQRSSSQRVAQVLAVVILFLLLFFMLDDLIAGFGFVGSSEYPTWIVLLLVTSFVIRTRAEGRSWLLVAMSIALASSAQLRPNQVVGLVLIMVTLVLLVDRSRPALAIKTTAHMVVAFFAVLSFSLLHNLYYGESFVPFTLNAGINYDFSWREVLGLSAGDSSWGDVWRQLRFMMYWNPVGNWSWAFAFWGSQLAWVYVVAYRLQKQVLLRPRSLLLLIPFGYAIPMLKYQMGSYYPRHLVAINLAFMCTALMAWPHDDESPVSADESPEPTEAELPVSTTVTSLT